MRIIFMGTPDFAVPPLTALLDAGYDVVAVCCQPDRPQGRGHKITLCPVKALAMTKGIPVLQFEKIRRREGRDALAALSPDLFVTAAFGQILSPRVLAIPRMGTVNVHASLLPRYRGPAPIAWCLINGERETGVTTMLTDQGIDTGMMLLSLKTPIEESDTAETLSTRLSAMGARLLVDTLQALESGTLSPIVQDETLATRCPMLTKTDGRLDFNQTTAALLARIRGVTPWPGAYAVLPNGEVLKVFEAVAADGQGIPGTVLSGLTIATGDSAIRLAQVQGAGGKKMATDAYLRGHPAQTGQFL